MAIPNLIYTSPLSFHKDVKEDFAQIKLDNPEAFARLAALFQQLRADTKIAEKLVDHGHGKDKSTDVSVSKWFAQWKTGKDLWRLKSWDMEDLGLKYRVIYLYLPQQARFVVMAVVKRENFDYDDENDPISKRVLASLHRTYGLG